MHRSIYSDEFWDSHPLPDRPAPVVKESPPPRPIGGDMGKLLARIGRILEAHPPEPDTRDHHALACSDGWVFASEERNEVRPCKYCRSVGHYIRDVYGNP